MELKISKQKAKKIFPDAPEYIKEILLETFGKECFVKKEFTDIKTFEDACAALDHCFMQQVDETDDELAYRQLKVIVKAINEGWTPNMNDTGERKWHPYFLLFDGTSAGFAYSYTYFAPSFAHTFFGSRLCFQSEAKAKHAGKQFEDIYKRFLL